MDAAEAELILGRTRQSKDLLDVAVGKAPSDWRVWNDLAAAQFTSAMGTAAGSQDLPKALDAALRSVELSAGRAEPKFNLVLISGKLGLSSPETATVSRASDRFAELRSALLAPDTALPSDWTSFLREFSGETKDALLLDAFPVWSRAVLAGHLDEASRVLDRIDEVANAVKNLDHDELLATCSARAKSASRSSLRLLAQGHLNYSLGKALYESNHHREAMSRLQAAERELQQGASPCSNWPQLDSGVVAFQAGRSAEAIATYRAVGHFAGAHQYLSLRARASWLEGVSLLGAGEAERSQNAYEAAITLYRQLGDVGNLLSVQSSAADGLRRVGALPMGWNYLINSLRDLRRLETPRRRYLVLYNAALYASDTGLPYASLAFQEGALKAARERGAVNTIVEALVQRARCLMSLGRRSDGLKDLAEAERLLPSIVNPTSVEYQGSWLRRAQAEFLVTSDPKSAANALSAGVFQLFQRREPVDVPGLFLLRARSRAGSGDFAGAVSDVDAGIAMATSIRRHLANDQYRVTFLDAVWGLFEERITASLHASDTAAAFAAAESGRQQGETDVMSIAELRRQLPPGSGVLYFVSLSKQLLVWHLSHDDEKFARLPVDRPALSAAVSAYRSAVEAGRERSDLIRADTTVSGLVDFGWASSHHIKRLYIAADGPLHALPFAALVNRETGRYLVEDVDIAFVRSARAAVSASTRSSNATVEKVLVVGGTRIAGVSLPGAEAEVSMVAAAYPGKNVVRGMGQTSPRQFKDLVPQFDVVHIAGHASADAVFPWSSFVLLAPDDENPTGRLRTNDLATLKLPRAPLIVLAACETAFGNIFRGEGAATLARPFVNAGAGAVVGTLWRAEDSPMLKFFEGFHAAYSSSGDAIAAVSAAQRKALSGVDPTARLPRNWSGVVVMRGDRSQREKL